MHILRKLANTKIYQKRKSPAVLPSRDNPCDHVDLQILWRGIPTSTELSPSWSSRHWDRALRPFIWVKLFPLVTVVSHLPSPFPFYWFQDITLPCVLLPLALVFFCLILDSFAIPQIITSQRVAWLALFFTLYSSPGIFYPLLQVNLLGVLLTWCGWPSEYLCLSTSLLSATLLFPAACYWTFLPGCLGSISA